MKGGSSNAAFLGLFECPVAGRWLGLGTRDKGYSCDIARGLIGVGSAWEKGDHRSGYVVHKAEEAPDRGQTFQRV
jgi:hypothetical protein